MLIEIRKATGQKDIAKLQKKVITNKKGIRQTVYVKGAGEEKKESLMDRLLSFFGFKTKQEIYKKLQDDYYQKEIAKQLKVTMAEWSNHFLEYFRNKNKWDTYFKNKSGKETSTGGDQTGKESDKKGGVIQVKSGIRLKMTVMEYIYNNYIVSKSKGKSPDNFETMPEPEKGENKLESLKLYYKDHRFGINFRKLDKIGLLDFTDNYAKIINEPYMPLSLDKLNQGIDENGIKYYDIAMAHNSVQNGDLMADPDMVVRIKPDIGTIEALTYQNDFVQGGVYQEVYTDGKVNLKLQSQLNTFLGQWLDNLKKQGFKYIKEEKDEGNKLDTGSGELSATEQAVLREEANVDPIADVPEAKAGDQREELIQSGSGFGERSSEHVRITKTQAKNIRDEVHALLDSKKDNEMTEADKELLRQYEGAGGLKEEGATTHGTLYEFYTPTAVVNKMWNLVNKYLGGKKNIDVLEPSAGTGRFAEGVEDANFDMFEIDPISARINKILNPDYDVKQSAFQELFFKNGVHQKEYKGKKYDVVIGNPPYGEYTGLHKGKGEGKEHKRYEEYFIDRGLDTLKEGGVMAFIVPSEFMRKDSNKKIKEKLAAKGKLMEAWRLPNGTFSTTGVGTDILIIRKEKGNVDDFVGDQFFKDNPGNILGEETTKTGQYGKPEKYVKPLDGTAFSDVFNMLDVSKFEVSEYGDKTLSEETKEKISIALEGNKNAKKLTKKEPKKRTTKYSGISNKNLEKSYKELKSQKDKSKHVQDNIKNIEKELQERGLLETKVETAPIKKEKDTIEKFSEKYHKKYEKHELDVWKATAWDGVVDMAKISKENQDLFRKSDSFCMMDGKVYHVANYASGDIYAKLEKLEEEKDTLGKAVYDKQKKILMSVLPEKKTVKNITVSPISEYAKEFNFGTEEEEDMLIDKFFQWATGKTGSTYIGNFSGQVTKHDLPAGIGWNDIVDYIDQKPVRTERARDAADRETNKQIAARTKELRRIVAEKLFKRFLETGLAKEEVEFFEKKYNEKLNTNVDPDYNNIPIFVDGISTTFKGKELVIKEHQLRGASFLSNKGNGLLAYDVGLGKAQPLESKILTPDGWVEMGSLQVGGKVIAANGKPTRIIGVYPQGEKDIFRVEFSDGSSTECCDEHLWAVQKPGHRNKAQMKSQNRWLVKELSEFMDDIYNSRGEKKYSIPIVEQIDFNEKETKIDPYLMGILIGDGSIKSRSTMISTQDKEVIKAIENVLPGDVFLNKKNNYDYAITTGSKEKRCKKTGRFLSKNSIKIELDKLSLSGCMSKDKFIPDLYKYNSFEKRLKLFQGLMDSDGYISKKGDILQFTSVSEKLIDDVTELIWSFGGTVRKNHKYPIYYYKGEKKNGQKAYTITIRLPKGIMPFQITRKKRRYKENIKYVPVRYITDVTYVGKKEAQCISIEDKSHLYVTDDYIVTHNTAVGILATINQLQTGRAKKPVICVPKAVYQNWIREIKDLFPDIEINELGNLGSKITKDGLPKIKDGSLSIMTYEALQNLTFKDETIGLQSGLSYEKEDEDGNITTVDGFDVLPGSIAEDMFESQKSGVGDKSERDRAKMSEKIMEMVGRGSKVKTDRIFIEDFGFDHITVDEVHNFKNVFGRTKPTNAGKGQMANEFADITGGESDRAIKMFAITQYIQKENNDRNVFALSATPFTNSPLEIYNILSLVARKKLKDMGIYNLHEFMARYAKIKMEWVAATDNTIKKKGVMKEFQNLGELQKLIVEYIDKIDGVEAGIERPKDYNHTVTLPQSAEQKQLMTAEQARMLLDPKENPGAILKAINNMRMSTLSTDLVKKDGINDIVGKTENFVESSPKLNFTCNVAANVYKEKPDVGQVIYMPRGIDDYGKVVDYLVSKGIPKNAIATIHSKISEDKIEKIKAEFNDPDGKIKILIGSETIQEGINLNGNSAVLYNTLLGWNPSERHQVKGRIWRQGNLQKNTHIIYPQIADSIDSAMYQKHDEKGARFEMLWSYKGDNLNVEDINAEELKFDIIKDPAKRAQFQLDLELETIDNDKRDKRISIDLLNKAADDIASAENDIPREKESIKRYEENIKEYEEELKVLEEKLKNLPKVKKGEKDIYENERSDYEWKINRTKGYIKSEKDDIRYANMEIKKHERIIERINEKLSNMGITLNDVPGAVAKIEKEVEGLVEKQNKLKADLPKMIEKAKADIKARNQDVAPLNETIKQYTDILLKDIERKVEKAKVIFAKLFIRDGQILMKAKEKNVKKPLRKTIMYIDGKIILKAKHAELGDIREHADGKKYKKVAPNKWVEVSEGKSQKDEKMKQAKKNVKTAEKQKKEGKRERIKNALKSMIEALTDVFSGREPEDEVAHGINQAAQDTKKVDEAKKKEIEAKKELKRESKK